MEEGKIENIICKMYVLNKSMIELILNIKGNNIYLGFVNLTIYVFDL